MDLIVDAEVVYTRLIKNEKKVKKNLFKRKHVICVKKTKDMSCFEKEYV
jgi:hypothetical protein